jgi:hypothetical protein
MRRRTLDRSPAQATALRLRTAGRIGTRRARRSRRGSSIRGARTRRWGLGPRPHRPARGAPLRQSCSLTPSHVCRGGVPAIQISRVRHGGPRAAAGRDREPCQAGRGAPPGRGPARRWWWSRRRGRCGWPTHRTRPTRGRRARPGPGSRSGPVRPCHPSFAPRVRVRAGRWFGREHARTPRGGLRHPKVDARGGSCRWSPALPRPNWAWPARIAH